MTWFVELLHRDGSVRMRVPVVEGELRIGRALDNDLVLDDVHTAAHHAQLEIRPDGVAWLRDLGSINGIVPLKGKPLREIEIGSELTVRLGHEAVRVRNSQWPVAPEQPIRGGRWLIWVVPVLLALAYLLWDTWLEDVGEKPPPYLYVATAALAALGVWSGLLALLGRLMGGVFRMGGHLGIVSTGFLALMAAAVLLDTLAFASGWLWPVQVSLPVAVLVLALTLRAHLRLADMRHWPRMRWGFALVTLLAMLVLPAQEWIENRQFSDIQTLVAQMHPSLRLAKPLAPQAYFEAAEVLRVRADQARALARTDESAEELE